MQKTLNFLKTIKTNNNKDWFDKNKDRYLEAKEEFELFVDKLIKGTAKFDKKISSDMKAKDCVFRIYKDVRFRRTKPLTKVTSAPALIREEKIIDSRLLPASGARRQFFGRWCIHAATRHAECHSSGN